VQEDDRRTLYRVRAWLGGIDRAARFFEDKAARARRFAAEMALQSYALRAAAEGAALAYAEVTGETWKAYEAPMLASAGVSRRGAAVEMAAFQTA
jgi:hypothetical protein